MSGKWDQYIVPSTINSSPETDKWSQYKTSETKESEKEQKIAKQFKFFGFEPSAESIEKIRQPTGYALKEFAGGLLGTPGDIAQMAQKLVGVEKPKEFLPTSATIGKGFEKLAGEKFQAQSTGQELLGETAGVLGSILGLGGPLKGANLAKSLTRTGLSAFIPASVALGARKAELPGWAQASAIVGSGLLTHRLTGKSMKQISKDLYDKAEVLGKDVMIPSENLVSRLDKLQGELSEGLTTAPKSRIHSMINEIKGKVSGGAIPVNNLPKYRRDINEVSKEFTKEQLKGSENYWKNLRNTLDETINEYGKTNPEFTQAYRQANSIHRGMNETRAIERFLTSNVLTAKLAGPAAIGAEVAAKMLGHGLNLGGIGVGTGIIKAAEFSAALLRNPGYRKAWFDVLKNASANEMRGTINSLKKFGQMSKNEGLIEEKE